MKIHKEAPISTIWELLPANGSRYEKILGCEPPDPSDNFGRHAIRTGFCYQVSFAQD